MIRNWRVMRAEPSGLVVWFDPSRESLRLYEGMELPKEGGVRSPMESGAAVGRDRSSAVQLDHELPW